MSLIEVKDLLFTYDNKINAIDSVSFSIEKGTYTTIIGHNGSGKSTLAKLLSGILEKKSGHIVIDGLELNETNLYQIRDKLGIVFQNPDNQFIGSTVKDDIAFGLENHQVEANKMESIILEYADKTGLNDFLNREPQSLSGGQKQRVAIAGALAMKPEIIIFDEATSMLDPKGKKDIKDLIKELHKESELTIISITHDIEEVMQSDKCLVLNKGQVYLFDKPNDVFKNSDKLRKVGLDIPFIHQFKEELSNLNIKVKGNDIDSIVKELCQLNSKN